MTESPVFGLVLRLSVPTTFSMLITSIYNLADTYFVSSLGNSAISAVGVVYSIQSIIQAVGYGFGMGSQSLISRKLEFLFLKGIYRARKKQFKIGTSININIKRECFSGNNYFPRSILFLYITLESLYKVSNTQSWKEKNYLLTTNCALLIADSVCVSNNTLMLLSRLL